MINIKQRGNIAVPISIVAAAIIIALAVVFTNKGATVPNENDPIVDTNSGIKLQEVTSADHIRGSIDAPIKIVEFSDIECPFCKRFHSTLQQVTAEYGDDVAWVYRHFPLVQLHPKAFNQANATECVAELGGEEKFWQFLDMIYERTPSNNQFDLDLLDDYAVEVGVDKEAFNKCQSEMRYKDKVNSQVAQAGQALGKGTPHTIVIGPNGEMIPIQGAQPYDVVKSVIDQLLAKQ